MLSGLQAGLHHIGNAVVVSVSGTGLWDLADARSVHHAEIKFPGLEDWCISDDDWVFRIMMADICVLSKW